MVFRAISDRVVAVTRSKASIRRRSSVKTGLILVLLLAVAGMASAATPLIKVGIVNLPPEESGYRQANVEDMNNGVFKGKWL